MPKKFFWYNDEHIIINHGSQFRSLIDGIHT
jgi:hypothetical protein